MKTITRTITIYTYVTGRFNMATMQAENVERHESPYKLGARDKRALEKKTGNNIIAETTREQLYSMTLEDFVKYAKPVDAAEVPDTETEDMEAPEAKDSEAPVNESNKRGEKK